MAPAPALSPPMVTWLGSPPNYTISFFFPLFQGEIYLVNVFLNPLQQLDHVLEATIQTTTLLDFLRCKEAIWANTVIERDDHNVEVRCFNQPGPVVVGIGQSIEPTALNPDKHWQSGSAGRIRRGVDVYVQAIFRLIAGDGINTRRNTQVTMLVTVSMTDPRVI